MKRLVPAVLAAALAVGGVAAGAQVIGAGSPQESAPVASAPAPTPTTDPTPSPEHDRPALPAIDPREPKHVKMWKFDAPVIPVDLDAGRLEPPADPKVLGWWGQPAGSAQGTTLLFGHTVSTGGGTLDDLEHTAVGVVADVSGVDYRVEKVKVISKAQLAKRAQRLFDQEGDPKLVLVTCEGYDPASRTYADNVVVIARPVG